jgi:tRNA (uracil-5-)-methyltransferase
MHSKVKEVVGLEIVPDAVQDATHNAELNGVTNARYICGKAEETLKTCLDAYGPDVPIIAVVDPPRAGLHYETVNALRRCRQIKTIVYVMCNPRQCTDNIKRLLGPCSKKLKQAPFQCVKAVPVDLFPHTPHTELVVMLERVEGPDAESRKPTAAEPTVVSEMNAVEAAEWTEFTKVETTSEAAAEGVENVAVVTTQAKSTIETAQV